MNSLRVMYLIKFMKKIFILLAFVIFCQVSFGQVYQLMPQYGYQAMRMNFDSTLQIPTVCGVPTLKSVHNTKRGAIAFDSCNNRFYTYNPKTLTWSYLGSGGGSTDTTSLSNRINQKVDSIKRTSDSVFYYKNGTSYFGYKDSVGNGWNTNGNTFLNSNATIYSDYNLTFQGYADELHNFEIDAGNIILNPFAYLRFQNLSHVNDTITYKPLVYDGSGNIYYHDSWSGSSSGFVPYTGATQDVDLGINKISAHSVYITGTNGNGHLHLKHQASDATATGQSTSLFADANGDIKWKNDGNYYTTLKTSGNTADRVYTYPNATTTLIGASDTATALSKYLRKTDTSTLSTRIDARIKYTDSATMLSPYLRKTDTSTLSTRIDAKVNISDTSVFQRKSVAAFTFRANNTASTANATDQVFRDSSTLTYSGTITWTGTTAPSGATSHRYRWCQIGKQVTITFTINYATAGSALSAVKLTLPVGCPAPTNFGTLTGANDILGSAWGFLGTATSTVSTGRVLLQNNATNNGYEFNISAASANYKVAGFTLTYFTD